VRSVVLLSLLIAAAPARAADGTLATGGSHEVVWAPPTPVPVRGPRFAAVTVDAYVALGHAQSYVTAELARRAVERAGDVRAVLHLSATDTQELALEALIEANEQGRFFALFDRMVQSHATNFAPPFDLVQLGREAGLDGDRLGEALALRRHRADAIRLQRDSHVVGHHPPELLVNGRRLAWLGEEPITRAIAEARLRADELLAEGVPLAQLYERILELDEEVPFMTEPLLRGPHRRLSIDLAGAPTRGPSTAPVTIVVWANFACMQCAELALSLKKLAEAHPGLVRVAWKHFPSPYRVQIGQLAAEYAAAAHAQGRFWELHDLAMASHLSPSRLTRGELDRLGAQVGLDDARLRTEIDSGRARAIVERDVEEARRLGVPQTVAGSVAVDGIPLAGASYERLEALVAAELDAGVLERLRRR
jgi:protein-disulfide isomerase